MPNISQQYRELKEGKISKYQFLHNARTMFPAYITNMNSLEDSIKILKNKGLLNEGEAVKGTPDKSPIYDYPDSLNRKYKKVEQSPEIGEQEGIYPATSLTDIPKPQREKKLSKVSDGLQPLKDKDEKNGMKKIRIRLVKESITENVGNRTYAIYLGTDIIYSHLPNERLKSVLYSLVNDLGEDLSDYIIVQNGTNHTKPADELGWDLSNVKPFDNINSLRTKIDNIANRI